MFRLFRYAKKYKFHIIAGPVFKIVEAIFELLTPFVMKSIIDDGIAKGDTGTVIRKGLLMVLLGVVGLCSTLVCQYVASVASQGFGTELRHALFSHIGTFSHAELDRYGQSTLLSRLTTDIDRLQKGLAMLVRLAVRVPFLIIGAIVMAFWIEPAAALIIALSVPFIALAVWFVTKKSLPFISLSRAKSDSITGITRETLSGTRVIRAFSAQNYQNNRFSEENDAQNEANIRALRFSALLNPFSQMTVNFGIAALLAVGGIKINIGSLSQGDLIALVSYIGQITVALIVACDLISIFTSAAASGKRVNEIFDTKPTVCDPESPVQTKDNKQPVLSLENVYFGYGDSGNSLENITLTAYSGEVIGLTGVTGSGKSTLLSLIPRYYDAREGSVKLYGQDVRTLSIDGLRKKISFVPQNISLLTGTVRDNLSLLDTQATDERMNHALSIACADHFISEMGGLDAQISQGGRNLSGGQRRRLTIARAMVPESDILLLDDAFVGLDNITEKNVCEGIIEECHQRGTLLILASQRLSSLRRCDRIYVLDDGMIIGSGCHDELMKNCDIYRDIWKSQNEEVPEND